MQYRHEIGHAPANFAFAADTKRKTSVPLFFASTGGLRLPSSMPILHQSLQFIDCYSPFLRRFSQASGSNCPSYRPIIHQSLHLIGFYSSSLRKFASTGGLRLPSSMPILHQSLQFIDCYSPSLRRFSQVSGSDCPLTDLLYISRFILLVSTVLRFASLASTGGLRLPLFKAYRVNIAPYYLFTLKNTFHYRKLYDIRVFV